MIESFGKTMTDFSFRGRSSKNEVILFIMFYLMITMLFLTVISAISVLILEMRMDFVTGTITIAHRMKTIGIIPFMLLGLAVNCFAIFTVWAGIMWSLLAIRRLHDINCSGIYFWIWLTCVISFCINQTSILTGIMLYLIFGGIIFLIVKDSYPYLNKYGDAEHDEFLNYISQNG